MSETSEISIDTSKTPSTPTRMYQDGLPIHRRQKTPVLCQNKGNTYRFVPEDTAREKIAEGLLVEIHPWDVDYIQGVKLALGHWGEGDAKTLAGQFLQVNGKMIPAAELGKTDVAAVIAEAEKEVAKYESKKKDGLLVATEMPASIQTFEGKKKRNRFS